MTLDIVAVRDQVTWRTWVIRGTDGAPHGDGCAVDRAYPSEQGSRMSAMHLADEVTIRAVCSYLHENFPEKRVVPFIERGVQEFRIDDIYGKPLHTLVLSAEFFCAHAPASIPAVLQQYHTAEALRRAGRAVVEVTDSGVTAAGLKPGRTKALPPRPETP